MAVRSSPEDLRLLNPAFLGIVVARAAQGFQKEINEPLPFIYAFLVPPLVLHSETRERLPSTVLTRLVSWAERNGDLVALFPRRLADVAPSSRRGILLAASLSLIALRKAASLEATVQEKVLVRFGDRVGSGEVRSILAKAAFVGRWLSTSGLPSTVLTTLGVRF